MRLAQPFVRLPLEVDGGRLAEEVAALDADIWRPHPEGAPGNTAVPLVAHNGDPLDDATRGPMRPTPHLAKLPYVGSVLSAFDAVIGRTRLMRIEEEGELTAHVDTNYYWWEHLRVHVPVLTSPDVQFECDGTTVHMAAGEVWVFDTWRQHRVSNPASFPRVHLVVDTVGSPSLWDLVERPDRDRRLIPADGPSSDLETESVNYPVVMSPWEIERNLDVLLAELGTVDPPTASRLATALTEFRHAWRAEWARHGDAPDGWAAFAALRLTADATVQAVAGDARLPNSVNVTEAVRQIVLRPSLAEHATPRAAASDARLPSPSRIPAPRPVSLDRPVFVVSSPRSGSTLFFETLARAAGLFTVGGESHHIIESVPALRPSAHGWESNRLTAADATDDSVTALTRGFIAELRDRDGVRPSSGPVRFLEKTPKNSLRIPFLAAAYPDAQFVYLYRDPRETISSMLEAWRSGLFVTYADLEGWNGPPWSLLLVPGWRDLSGRPLGEIVTRQWASATTVLLDDLDALDPGRWCVASYDRLVGDPQAEMASVAAFIGLDYDVDLSGPLPLARHTVDSPHPDKWRRNAGELEQYWDGVEELASRALDLFATRPRVEPVRTAAHAPTVDVEVAPHVAGAEPTAAAPFRSVHTANLAPMLANLGCSLIVSTYQTGRVIIVRAEGESANTHFCGFAVPMGIAYAGGDLAIGTKTQVHLYRNQPALTRRLEPEGKYDACFVPRSTHTTGDVRIHDLAFAAGELWMVNTRFSCLATLDGTYSFVPKWRPPFVSALAPEDRCHLNGLAVVDGEPRYVTALGMTDEPGGWRDDKATGGVVLDVRSGEPVVTGLCMPHSPRWYDGRLWVLESGNGRLGTVDVASGAFTEVARVPGFARGLSFAGPFAFIGLSQVREQVFEGLPLTADGVERNCGVWVVDLRTGDIAAFLQFEGDVHELFEVTVLPGVRFPELLEPGAELIENAFVLPDAALADVPESARS